MKHYIQPEDLRRDSFELAMKVVEDGYKPDFMVALWRGGAPIGCYVHELLKYKGIKTDHIAIRTSRYTGIDQAAEKVKVFNLNYLVKSICQAPTPPKILLVDDVFDSGATIEAFVAKLSDKVDEYVLANSLNECDYQLKIATVYYKPTRNQTKIIPHYYVRTSSEWLVFPHEISDMDPAELELFLGGDISQLINK